jgi:hypothetical protein
VLLPSCTDNDIVACATIFSTRRHTPADSLRAGYCSCNASRGSQCESRPWLPAIITEGFQSFLSLFNKTDSHIHMGELWSFLTSTPMMKTDLVSETLVLNKTLTIDRQREFLQVSIRVLFRYSCFIIHCHFYTQCYIIQVFVNTELHVSTDKQASSGSLGLYSSYCTLSMQIMVVILHLVITVDGKIVDNIK